MRTAQVVAVGAVVFLVCQTGTRWLLTANPEPVWLGQAVFKGALIAVAFTLMRAYGLLARDCGFRMPESAWRRASILPAIAMGAVATGLMLASGARHPGVSGFSIGALILWVWIWSSLSEEIFVRGWLQSALGEPGERAAWISGVVFGAMHLSLFFRGSAVGAAIIVAATTVLGVFVARLRWRHASLLPPLAAHMAFNIGGTVAGILYAIGYRIATGRLPTS